MKNKDLLLSVIGMFFLVGFSAGQTTIHRYRGTISPSICYASGKHANISIPASESTIRSLKSGTTKKTQFIVTYHNFPNNAKAAFQYALDIWSMAVFTPIAVRVDAVWDNTLSAGVLGATSPSSFYNKIQGSFIYEAYYPVALAEKILGNSIDSSLQPDINISINPAVNWYYGTDANPGFNQYDLATVTLHEICHGLGFTGTFYADNNPMGYYGEGLDNKGSVFDYYVKNGRGLQLVDTNNFKNPSIALGVALTTPNNVFFDGAITRKANGNKVMLYSPINFDNGSSIYHVSQSYANTINGLMYYAIDMQEAIHNPGPMLTGIMGDLGWINTWIHHDTLPDIESISGPRIINATIQSDTSIITGSFYLYRSFDNFITYDSIQMQPTANPNEYSSGITIPKLGTYVSYYLSVRDIFNRNFTLPGNAPVNHFKFFAGKDTIPPFIQHMPVQLIIDTTRTMKLSARVTDNIGVDTVYVEYKHNNSTSLFIAMPMDSVSVYGCNIDLSSFSLNPGDSLLYRIIAIDKSIEKNIGYAPDSGFYVIPIVNIPTPVTSYYTTFDTLNNDFLFNGFNISTAAGFRSQSLNSIHPYASPDMDNRHINYWAQLRVPIIINKSNAFILFDEVALVEPNDSGYTFGTSGFYDYVIVEGSKNGGQNWYYFAPGWNCTAFPDWYNRFESDFDKNGNSLATADLSLYHKRHLDMLSSGYFNGGDTVLIRFRLYSDPYTFGWGWTIDNLNIQNTVMGISNLNFAETGINLFPNPASTELNLKINLQESAAKIQFQLFNTLGSLVKNCNFSDPGNSINEIIELDGLQGGVYLAVIGIDGKHFVKKVCIVR
jgi:Secretion system C-terminal sorting domain